MSNTESLPDSPWAQVQGLPAVLSVRQPWAWALVNGHKDVENRSWQTTHRGLLAIHASRRPERDGYHSCEQMGLHVPDDLPLGAIVGAVELVDVVRDHASPWASSGGFNWVLGRAYPIDPLPMNGRLGIFAATTDVAERLVEAIGDR